MDKILIRFRDSYNDLYGIDADRNIYALKEDSLGRVKVAYRVTLTAAYHRLEREYADCSVVSQ